MILSEYSILISKMKIRVYSLPFLRCFILLKKYSLFTIQGKDYANLCKVLRKLVSVVAWCA